jgi:hypothetical protein
MVRGEKARHKGEEDMKKGERQVDVRVVWLVRWGGGGVKEHA